MELGKINKLKAARFAPQGMYFTDEDGNEVLLPNSRLPKEPKLNQEYEVFVYRDSQERLIASLDLPLAQVNEFAALEAKERVPFGVFMDWGLDKQVLVPLREMREELEIGEKHAVYLYIDDKSERVVASTRLELFFDREIDHLQEQDRVEVVILERSSIGYKVAVKNRYQGMLYHNEIYQELSLGQKVNAYIKKLRTDGKVDLILQPEGMDHIEPSAQAILERLKEKEGFLALHDKSDPALIQQELKMSKKTFKKAIGTLYKKRLVELKEDGIHLISTTP